MKTPSLLRILLPAAALAAILAVGVWAVFALSNLPDVGHLADRGSTTRIQVRDWAGTPSTLMLGPENPFWTPLERMPAHLRDAVVAAEDFSFYGHNGIDWYEVWESLKQDLRERRFARGGSTITQQLAKNLFLSREKTFRRKLREVVLARRLEKSLTKDRILELYLNVVELGNMVHGVGEGALYHFGRRPSELTLRQSSLLAAMLPGPRVYSPGRRADLLVKRSEHILAVMLKGGKISEDQYRWALEEVPLRSLSELEADLPPRTVPAAAEPIPSRDDSRGAPGLAQGADAGSAPDPEEAPGGPAQQSPGPGEE
ncbi:MAG: transglycosylase domain-containing protein [bacterium]|nr:MAG: transglycosylase domain-containing protein [bacterium]